MAFGMGAATAQTINVAGTLKGSAPADLRLCLLPVEKNYARPDSIAVEGGQIKASAQMSAYGIYHLVGISRQRQVIVPVYMAANKDGKATLNVTLTDEGRVDVADADASTRALTAFNNLYMERSRSVWMDGKTMEAEALKRLVTGYPSAADSIIAANRPNATTTQYLRLWAQMLTYEAMESLKFSTGRDATDVGIDRNAIVAATTKAVDCDMAAIFDAAPRAVLASVGKGSLTERIGRIENRYKNVALKKRAEGVLLEGWLSAFDYSAKYDEGLKELAAATERYKLDAKYLADFKMRKSSVAGTPFPGGIVLEDLDGHKVDFAKYRGKYVYIDLWASWCVPCIKEIPHLKALERDLQNKDVVFLSISIDTNVEAWKKKVKALGLEGNLLINRDNSLPKALNVSGIPFFIVYDNEGRLYKYNAPRPSDVRTKPLLEGLGK